MRKILLSLGLTVLLTSSVAMAAPNTETDVFHKGAVQIEVGSTLNSKVKGTGRSNTTIDGEFGYKTMLTAGLNDRWAVQYKHGLFRSEEATAQVPYGGMNLPLTTYAQARLNDVNLLYKATDNLTLIVGYEHTSISYGKFVEEASASAMHVGVQYKQPISKDTTLFATLVGGKDVSLREFGVSQKLSPVTTFNASYADRRVNNVDLKVSSPVTISDKEHYQMTGITCMFDIKL